MLKAIKTHATAKSILGIVIMLLLFAAIILLVGLKGFTDQTLQQYSEGAFQTAEAAAEIVDADRMDAYAQSGGITQEYMHVWEQLDYLCNVSGSMFVYVIQPDRSDYAHITFLFSTINHKSEYTKYDFGYVRDTTNDEYKQKYANLYDLVSERELVIRDRGYIETDPHITAMIGLKGSDGQVKAILCVQRQMDVLVKARTRYLASILLTLAVLTFVFIAAQVFFLNKTLLRPLTQISDEAKRFATENVPATVKLADTVRNTDEIGQLAASIDHMEEQVQAYVDDLMSVTAEKERLSTELELASRIQASMLPSIFPAFPDRTEFDIFASMDPAKEVGGDFYDFFMVDDNHLAMVIADVSGKGVPAALFMMVSKILVQNLSRVGHSPKEVLEIANRQICSNNHESMFVTVWIGVVDLTTGKMVAANAGHEYPALKQGDGSFELLQDRHGVMVGVFEASKYTEYEVQLQPGDKVFVYTDGVPEAMNAQEELFGTDRMLEALHAADDKAPQQLLEAITVAVTDYVGDADQFDDITMLGFLYNGPARK